MIYTYPNTQTYLCTCMHVWGGDRQVNRGTRSHFSHVSVTHKPRETQREGRGHAIIMESAKDVSILRSMLLGLGWLDNSCAPTLHRYPWGNCVNHFASTLAVMLLSPGTSLQPCTSVFTTPLVHGKFPSLTFITMAKSWRGLNKKMNFLLLSLHSHFLSLVSPMSHGWPSTRTKYLTEEKCLPTAASVSLAGSADSWGLARELFLQAALWGRAISWLPSSQVLFPTASSRLERGICIYLSFRESAIV